MVSFETLDEYTYFSKRTFDLAKIVEYKYVRVEVPDKTFVIVTGQWLNESYPVLVANAKDEMHARLIAYCRIYGKNSQPSESELLLLTSIDKKVWTADAEIYSEEAH